MAIKNRITVNLSDDEYQALMRISQKSQRSVAWLGRKAICEFMAGKDQRELELMDHSQVLEIRKRASS